MTNQAPQKNVSAAVLAIIKDRAIRMRPRWFFVLRAILFVVGGVSVLLTLLYVVSFILFAVRQTGVWFVPAFGWRGWRVFLFSLPWMLIGLVFVFLVVLELMVRHYAFAYRRPLLYSALGIMTMALVGGYAVASSPLHRRLENYTTGHHWPVAGRMYRQYGHHRFRDIHAGQIIATTTGGFIMNNRQDETITVIITPQTRLPYGADFALGNTVVVFGDKNDGHVMAVGIRAIPE